MRRRLFLGLALVPALSGLTLPAAAHHGWGTYDSDHPVTATVTLDQVAFENPHVMAMVTIGGTMWHVLLAPPSRMQARGATAELVKPGATVTLHAFPRRDGEKELRADWIEIGGSRFELR